MELELTDATQRALHQAQSWCSGPLLEGPAVLHGLLSEPECRAAILLEALGIDADSVRSRWPRLEHHSSHASISNETPAGDLVPRFSPEMEIAIAIAQQWLADLPRPLILATEHLLMGMAATEHEVGPWLREHNLKPEAVRDEILSRYGLNAPHHDCEPVPVEASIPDEGPPSSPATEEHVLPAPERGGCRVRLFEPGPDGPNVVRLLDASANRAREALRVVEDFVRFVLDDRHLTERLKSLRHGLTTALAELPMSDRLAMRDTQADVGTRVSTKSEFARQDTLDVVTANFTRLEEALRSLEEFGKIGNPDSSQLVEQLRYDAYTLQKAVQGTVENLDRLEGARLYVLVDGRRCADEFETLVLQLVGVGVDVIQLRDKKLGDRTLLARARQLRDLTASQDTLFVMNDRPDLAVLASADGVHVGQEELTVRDVRQIVGPRMLVGVSTHNLDQARQAVLDGASYLGVGPMFSSTTKAFSEFPGVEFARSAASEIRLPAFAIGGIGPKNLDDVLATGIGRVAVSGAIASATDPARAARELLGRLKADMP